MFIPFGGQVTEILKEAEEARKMEIRSQEDWVDSDHFQPHRILSRNLAVYGRFDGTVRFHREVILGIVW